MTDLHALIIEDEVQVACLVEEALRGSGYRSFDVAFSASEALEAARRRCPDLITADLRLVDGTGVDAVLEICSENPIPVVFITANPAEISRRIPDAIIVEKPFLISGVEGALAQAVRTPFLSPAAR
ncbi:MAG TPA: response regulator [Allosphingosinicella sp.]|nr:response regulator [Allosphingosinicella sp.]